MMGQWQEFGKQLVVSACMGVGRTKVSTKRGNF